MKKLFWIAAPLLLSGCAVDSINNLVGSKYESFDGKYIDHHLDQTNRPQTNATTSQEFANVVNTRAAADKDLITNPYVDKYLDGILAKILKQWDLPVDQNVAIVVSSDRNYSAFATPNTIVITQGVLADAESEDEIAFIIAHELSHILLKHNENNEYFAKQSALVSKTANIAMSTAVITDMKAEKTANGYRVTSQNKSSTTNLIQDSYRTGLTINRLSRDVISSAMSRSDEDEADLLGMDLLVKAGYSPRAFSPVLERLDSSQKFTQAQLKAKKEEFQSFVSLATDASKHLSSDNKWSNLGYLAANEAGTRLLQNFAARHTSPIERKKDMSAYVKREYRKERRRPLSSGELEKTVKTGKGSQIQQNYWYASEAFKALEFGDIETAEKLARKSISGPTKNHAYPRLAFYGVRKAQNLDSKALQNLALITNWDHASIQTFTLAAQSYREQKKPKSSLKLLAKGEQVIGTQVPFLPEYIATHKALGNDTLVAELLSKCKSLSEDNIVAQCHNSAGVAIPQSKSSGNSLMDSFNSFTNLVEL
ncbi:M48 family metallopeptidase [Vibrio sinaloensis]|uniref:M48 family metallopeptidase n=1 Tax=Photobacterium sp. (strain ATCC 43367) TaxID=379097 RepID=UPI0022B005C7|nr:M48 family metallopeptidase [Vibrio sinaloensis]MCZ4294057.1 M48 family metalloprotease [Vibrio sinaloensis]